MKPFHVFAFVLLALASVWGVSVIISTYQPAIWGFKLSSPIVAFNDSPKVLPYKDISHIIQLTRIVDSSEHKTIEVKVTEKNVSSRRPLLSKSEASVLLQFPSGNDTLLDPLFRSLDKASTSLVRIMHYGDSQIEGDRITSYLRNQFQQQFGGYGIGFIPVVAVAQSSFSYVYSVSDNWQRFTIKRELAGVVYNSRTGPLFNFARMVDQSRSQQAEQEGWIDLQHSNIAYPRSQQFDQCRIFYGFNSKPMMVQMTQAGRVLDAEIVPSSRGLSELRWLVHSPNDIHISFQTKQTPDVYGIALDGLTGVAVDNVPLRGSQGLDFSKADLQFLKAFYNRLNVKLLILQFGANVVPTIANNYVFFEKNLSHELATFKSAIPGISIIVIGVNDVSRRTNNAYESYPNIEKIRDAQRKAALANGCAFWDLFEAMGGRNSMPGWVFASPPLAQKDFVHFSPLGAKTVAEMFYRAFAREYQKFENGHVQ